MTKRSAGIIMQRVTKYLDDGNNQDSKYALLIFQQKRPICITCRKEIKEGEQYHTKTRESLSRYRHLSCLVYH